MENQTRETASMLANADVVMPMTAPTATTKPRPPRPTEDNALENGLFTSMSR